VNNQETWSLEHTAGLLLQVLITYLPSHLPWKHHALRICNALGNRHTIYSAALNTEATATFMFLPSWKERMTTNPYTSLGHRHTRTSAKYWAHIGSYHQNKSNMQYPSGTIYRCHFLNTLEICRSLPYRILEAESASIPTIKTGKKGLPQIFQRQGGKTMTNNDPFWHKKNRP